MKDVLNPLIEGAKEISESSLAILECWRKFRQKKMTWSEMIRHTFMIVLQRHSDQLEYRPLPPPPEEIKEINEVKQMINDLREKGKLNEAEYRQLKELKEGLRELKERYQFAIKNYRDLIQRIKNQNRANRFYLTEMKELFKDNEEISEKINKILIEYYEKI
jgi:transcriptional regulator of heat shock response